MFHPCLSRSLFVLLACTITWVQADTYVSPSGNDQSGDGSAVKPYASLSKARDVLRASEPAGKKVIVKGGDYFLTEPLIFDERDKGTAQNPARYEAAPGEKPILYGGVRLNNWTLVQGKDYYKTSLGNRVYTLFENNERAINTEQTVKVVEWGMTDVIFSKAANFPTKKGEFYYEESTGFLYYQPFTLPIESQTIVGTKEKIVVGFRGSSNKTPVANIHFSGLTLKYSDFGSDYQWLSGHDFDYRPANDGMLHLENAQSITISNCQLLLAGLNGITLYGHAQNNVIQNCEIINSGFNNILLTGHPIAQTSMNGYNISTPSFASPEESYVNKKNQIDNNLCLKSGQLIVGSYGILLYQSGDNQITHNEVREMGREGIRIHGRGKGLLQSPLYGLDMYSPFENRYRVLHTRNNYIGFNKVVGVGQGAEVASVVQWGAGENNILDNNFLSGGLYLDDDAWRWTMQNNIILGNFGTKGAHHRFYNNIFINGASDFIGYGENEKADAIFKANIFYVNIDWQWWIRSFIQVESKNMAAIRSDSNCYFSKQVAKFGDGGAINWEQWQGAGKDLHSLQSDPLFVDFAAGNYTVQSKSPALGLGFKQIDWRSIGIKKSNSCETPVLISALNPSAYSMDNATSTQISWQAEGKNGNFNIYFGTSNPPPLVATQNTTSYNPGPLQSSTKYYWRVNSSNFCDTIRGTTMEFGTQGYSEKPAIASNPLPIHNATIHSVTTLSWTKGNWARSHDVYFGLTNPPPFIQNQSQSTYALSKLESGKTYYWRIDEVGSSKTTGEIWSFTLNSGSALAKKMDPRNFKKMNARQIRSGSLEYQQKNLKANGRLQIGSK